MALLEGFLSGAENEDGKGLAFGGGSVCIFAGDGVDFVLGVGFDGAVVCGGGIREFRRCLRRFLV